MRKYSLGDQGGMKAIAKILILFAFFASFANSAPVRGFAPQINSMITEQSSQRDTDSTDNTTHNTDENTPSETEVADASIDSELVLVSFVLPHFIPNTERFLMPSTKELLSVSLCQPERPPRA